MQLMDTVFMFFERENYKQNNTKFLNNIKEKESKCATKFVIALLYNFSINKLINYFATRFYFKKTIDLSSTFYSEHN